ncbi:MAG: DUF1573 domain-containing protein [Planctomycetota bacterium]
MWFRSGRSVGVRTGIASAFAATVPLIFPRVASAELSWESRSVTLEASALDASVDFAFPFENTGEAAVTVTSIRPSCGCTAAQLDEPTIEAGESSAIAGSFTIGDRRGKQSKTIVVRTDDPDRPVVTLRLTVQIAEAVRATPRLVFWRDGEARTPKTVEVAVHEPERLALTAAELSAGEAVSDLFSVSLEPMDEAAEANADLGKSGPNEAAAADATPTRYRVTVSPKADAGDARAMVALRFAEALPSHYRAPALMVRTMGTAPETAEADGAAGAGE